jgi:hypothetical protein
MEKEITVTKVKQAYYVEDDGSQSFGYGFTGLIIQLEDGRVISHNVTDPMNNFTEVKGVSIKPLFT